MVPCTICSSDINDDGIYYLFGNMAPDIVSAIENRLSHEVDENGVMCANCFTSAMQLSAPAETHVGLAECDLQRLYSNVCVWCQCYLYSKRTHSLPEGHERRLILQRISPRQIPDHALVCHSCWVRVRYILEQDQKIKAIPKGSASAVDINNCVSCLRSLTRTHRYSIPHGPVRNEVSKRIQPREIPAGGHICFACWVSAYGSMKKADTIDQTRQDPDSANTHPDVHCGSCGVSLLGRESHILPIYGPTRDAAETNNPKEITENEYVCNDCWKLVNHSIVGDQAPPPLRVSHRNVCVTCGRSVFRTRKQLVMRPDATERDQTVAAIFSEWLRPYQITNTAEACKPCWSRAKRAADLSIQSIEASQSFKPEIPTANVPLEDQTGNQLEKLQQPIIDQGYITLSNVRRAASNSGHCIFLRCTNRERLRVPSRIRGRVVKNWNFYITNHSRICGHHLKNGLFHELYYTGNAKNTFGSQPFEDMIDLLSKGAGSIDFSDPEMMEERLFQYFFGFTHSQYDDLINECPRLNKPKLKYGLNALLLKMQTRDSNERIAKLFQVSRKTLESYMKQARGILVKDFVPRNMGSIV